MYGSMIYVTGGTGYVGTAVCRALREKGLMVTALSRTKQARPVLATGGGIEFRSASVTDPASLAAAIKNDAGAVVHLVGIIYPAKGQSFEKVHVEGTRNAVEAAKNAGAKRFLHMSAIGARVDGITPYQRTKGQAEEIVRASGLDWTIFRPSIIFGEGDAFVNMFAGMARSLPFMPVIGSGKSRMQPVWVEDVAAAFAHAIGDDRTIGQTYDLGGPAPMTVLEILDIVMRTTGKRRPRVHIPAPLMSLQAGLLEKLLPKPPVTRDQIKMLGEDNVVVKNGFSEISSRKMTSLEEGAPYFL
ncbi:MAG: complex I NDUFA9 subunit family protein [bacterium]